MINKPSLLDTPNLINAKEYTPGLDPVDNCYANDSTIRGDYDGTDISEWNTGKQVQETLPAAEWDAFIHDIGAFGWQMTEVINSIYEELYSAIHGQQVGMPHELLDKFTALPSNTETLTNKTISFYDNTLTGVASLDTAQTLTNKTINFANNTLTGVASTSTSQTLTNKTISFSDNTLTGVASLDTAQTLTNKTIAYSQNTMPGVQPTLTAGAGINITGTTISATKVYSTSEQLTGDTWIDGKPIYRKIYQFSTGTVTAKSIKRVLLDANIKNTTHTPVRMYGVLKADRALIAEFGTIPIPSTVSNAINGTVSVLVNTELIITDGPTAALTGLNFHLICNTNQSDWSDCNCVVVIEYVKLT